MQTNARFARIAREELAVLLRKYLTRAFRSAGKRKTTDQKERLCVVFNLRPTAMRSDGVRCRPKSAKRSVGSISQDPRCGSLKPCSHSHFTAREMNSTELNWSWRRVQFSSCKVKYSIRIYGYTESLNNPSFQYASPRLWNQLPASLRQQRINLCNSSSPSSLSGTLIPPSVPSTHHFHHPLPLHSFNPSLKLSFSVNPSHRSLSFSSSGLTTWIPHTFTVTSEHIRFYFLVFLFYTF